MRVSVWDYAGQGSMLDHASEHIEALEHLNIHRMAIMVNRQKDAAFNMSLWTRDGLMLWAERLAAINMGLIITVWVRPWRTYIDHMASSILPLARDIGDAMGLDVPVPIEFDLEGFNWTRRPPKGFPNKDMAGVYLIGSMTPHVDAGGEWSTTTVTTLPAWEVSRGSGYVCPQAYSIWSDRKARSQDSYAEMHGWDGVYGPGSRQCVGYRVHRTDDGGGLHRVVMGLPAWAQVYPRHSAHEAMQRAWDASVDLGVDEARYWAWSHIVGRGGAYKGYAWRFLEKRDKQ